MKFVRGGKSTIKNQLGVIIIDNGYWYNRIRDQETMIFKEERKTLQRK